MGKRLALIYFLSFLWLGNAIAQNPLLDSLKIQLSLAADSLKGAIFREIIIQTNLINPDSALSYVGKLRAYAISQNDSARLIEAKSFEAEYYWRKGDYKTSMTHAMEALTMAESSMKFFARRGTIYFTLGNIHLYLLNTDQAIDYFKRALENYEEQKTKPKQVASILNNIGVVYMDAAESRKEVRYLDSAEIYFNRVLDKNTVANPGTLINASGNLGLIYLQRDQLIKSLEAFRRWEKLEASNPSTTAQAMHLGNIGRLHMTMGEVNKGVEYLLRGLNAAKEIGAIHEEQEYYGNLAQAYAKLGEYKQAYHYAAFFQSMRDSVFNAEKTKTISELEAKYQSTLKEQQITELQQVNIIKDLEVSSANQRQIFLILGLLMLSVSVFVLYNRNQIKQRTAKALDEKNNELQKLNTFKDKMFAVISHDLRNPVDGFSNLMENLNQNVEHASKEELKEFLETTLNSARDLKGLLNNLLEWAMVQIGRLPFNPKPEAVRSIALESAEHLAWLAKASDIKIENNSGEDKVRVDKSMMVIALRNLLSNAIKFSGQGGNVEIYSSRNNSHIILSVKDHGIGMTDYELASLFNPEANVKAIGSSPAKGTGIGLLLCKELIEKNNGRIFAESELGKGSTFHIELPSA